MNVLLAVLRQMYIEIYGEDKVNVMWLNVLSEDEIVEHIVDLAKKGKIVVDDNDHGYWWGTTNTTTLEENSHGN